MRKSGGLNEAEQILSDIQEQLIKSDHRDKYLIHSYIYEKATQLYFKGEYAKSTSILNDLKNDNPGDYLKSRALNLVGIINFYLGNFDIAEAKYRESLEIKKKYNNLHEIAKTLNNLGEVKRVNGDLDEALKFHEESLKLKQQIGNSEEIKISFINLGEIYSQKGDIENTIVNYEEAISYFEEMQNEFYLAEIYYRIISVLLKWDFPRALDYLEKFRKISENSDLPFVQEKFVYTDALLLRHNDNPRDTARAQNLFESLVLEETSDFEIKFLSMINIIEIILEFSEEEDSKAMIELEIISNILRMKFNEFKGNMMEAESYKNLALELSERKELETIKAVILNPNENRVLPNFFTTTIDFRKLIRIDGKGQSNRSEILTELFDVANSLMKVFDEIASQ
jgi:tetratricopeptide (TPR) repeat protein